MTVKTLTDAHVDSSVYDSFTSLMTAIWQSDETRDLWQDGWKPKVNLQALMGKNTVLGPVVKVHTKKTTYTLSLILDRQQ